MNYKTTQEIEDALIVIYSLEKKFEEQSARHNAELERQNKELKKQLHEQGQLIARLRRDFLVEQKDRKKRQAKVIQRLKSE